MLLGATTPPLHDEISAWRPLFTEKCTLRRYPMTPLFKFCDQNVRQMYKSRRYLVQKLMNFLNQESKIFAHLQRAFSLSSLRRSLFISFSFHFIQKFLFRYKFHLHVFQTDLFKIRKKIKGKEIKLRTKEIHTIYNIICYNT